MYRDSSPSLVRFAISFLLLGTLASVSRSVSCDRLLLATSSNGATTVDPNAIVAAVNAKRAQHNSPPVTWDPTIASYSQNYAEKLASQQQGGSMNLEHSTTNYGENLYTSSAPSKATIQKDFQSAINSWYKEKAQYDFSSGAFDTATGHFTQLVWKATKKIGAGAALSPDGQSML